MFDRDFGCDLGTKDIDGSVVCRLSCEDLVAVREVDLETCLVQDCEPCRYLICFLEGSISDFPSIICWARRG